MHNCYSSCAYMHSYCSFCIYYFIVFSLSFTSLSHFSFSLSPLSLLSPVPQSSLTNTISPASPISFSVSHLYFFISGPLVQSHRHDQSSLIDQPHWLASPINPTSPINTRLWSFLNFLFDQFSLMGIDPWVLICGLMVAGFW